MKKALNFLWKVAKCVFYIGASAWLVLEFPLIAVAFVAVWVAKRCKDEYERVIVSAVVSVFAAFLILNFAEVAILATLLPVHDVTQAWSYSVKAA